MAFPKNKQFTKGQIVYYSHPGSFMVRSFGRRVYSASIETESLIDEHHDKEYFADINDPQIPPDEGFGLVLCSCIESRHGAGTVYYKILLGEQLFWIASEHLSTKGQINV